MTGLDDAGGPGGGSRGPHPRPSTPLPPNPTSMHPDPEPKHRRQQQTEEQRPGARLIATVPVSVNNQTGANAGTAAESQFVRGSHGHLFPEQQLISP